MWIAWTTQQILIETVAQNKKQKAGNAVREKALGSIPRVVKEQEGRMEGRKGRKQEGREREKEKTELYANYFSIKLIFKNCLF